jgi:putative phage-type endonuclease
MAGPVSGVQLLRSGVSRVEWLAARRCGITATDVVRIVGLSPHGNALDVYLDKRVGEPERDRGEAAAWGAALEDVVARRWADLHGCRVRRVGLMRHRTLSHHLASLDRVVVAQRAPLEVKTRNVFADDFGDGVPERVAVQVQWQLHVMGAGTGHVAALIGGQELVSWTVPRDQVLIDYLVGEADRVWAAVRAGVPPQVPPWQQTAAALDRLHRNRAGAVDLDPDVAGPLLAAYRDAAAAEKAAKAAKAAARVQLLTLLGGHEEALLGGRPAFTYRAHTTTEIHAGRLRQLLADHPDVAGYTTTTTTRRFIPARTKED